MTTTPAVQVPVSMVMERLSDAGALLDRAARSMAASVMAARRAGLGLADLKAWTGVDALTLAVLVDHADRVEARDR